MLEKYIFYVLKLFTWKPDSLNKLFYFGNKVSPPTVGWATEQSGPLLLGGWIGFILLPLLYSYVGISSFSHRKHIVIVYSVMAFSKIEGFKLETNVWIL